MKRALITGITGQDGLYLAELLLSKGYEVYGLIRGQNNPKRALLEELVPDVKLLTGDLTDLSSLMRAMSVAQPDEFYNLGAISFVAYSWENAHLTSEVTGMGVLNALEAVRLYSGFDGQASALLPGVELRDVRQGAAGSAERGHPAVAALPVRRRQGLRPLHDDQLPRVLRHARVIRHPVQPRVAAPRPRVRHPQGEPSGRAHLARAAGLVDFGQSGRQARLGLRRRLCRSDVAHAAARRGRRLRDFHRRDPLDPALLDAAFGAVGINDWSGLVKQDPRFMRPAEVDLLIGDSTKAREKLGWVPKVGFPQLIAMMVESDVAEQKTLAGLA